MKSLFFVIMILGLVSCAHQTQEPERGVSSEQTHKQEYKRVYEPRMR